MRPIDKGLCPQVGGVDKTVAAYQEWRADLIDRLGYYCVYCNMPLSEQLQVEHVTAKVPVAGAVAGAALAWSNMLLACGVCNRAKSNAICTSALYYLPEEHNSHLPFIINQDPINANSAIVIERPGISNVQQLKARATIDFFHLDVIDTRGKIVDLRWKKRRKAIDFVAVADMFLQSAKIAQLNTIKDIANGIATLAAECGFFTLWYDKFQNEPEVMEALTNNGVIKGTATICFDNANGFKPIARNPTNLPDTF